jgi:hypothetical protein
MKGATPLVIVVLILCLFVVVFELFYFFQKSNNCCPQYVNGAANPGCFPGEPLCPTTTTTTSQTGTPADIVGTFSITPAPQFVLTTSNDISYPLIFSATCPATPSSATNCNGVKLPTPGETIEVTGTYVGIGQAPRLVQLAIQVSSWIQVPSSLVDVTVIGVLFVTISSPAPGQTNCTTCGPHYYLTNGTTNWGFGPTYSLIFPSGVSLPAPGGSNSLPVEVTGRLSNMNNCVGSPAGSQCLSGTITVASWTQVSPTTSTATTTSVQ